MRVVLSPFCAPWESNDGVEHRGSLDGTEQLFHELAPPVREMVKRRVRVPHSLYRVSGAPSVANGHHHVARIWALFTVVSVPSRLS